MTIESESENQLVLVATDERVAIVTLNNPPAHVLSRTMTDELIRAFEDLRRLDLAAVIITGRGSHFFCAGADIRELVQNPPREPGLFFPAVLRSQPGKYLQVPRHSCGKRLCVWSWTGSSPVR